MFYCGMIVICLKCLLQDKGLKNNGNNVCILFDYVFTFDLLCCCDCAQIGLNQALM